MDTREFPAHPNLEQYRKQAKEFLKAYRSADMDTMVRVRKTHPRFRKLAEAEFRSAPFALADAQLKRFQDRYTQDMKWPVLWCWRVSPRQNADGTSFFR